MNKYTLQDSRRNYKINITIYNHYYDEAVEVGDAARIVQKGSRFYGKIGYINQIDPVGLFGIIFYGCLSQWFRRDQFEVINN